MQNSPNRCLLNTFPSVFIGRNFPQLNLNDIGRNCLLGNRKKIAKFLRRTFTCRSTFLYAWGVLYATVVRMTLHRGARPKVSHRWQDLRLNTYTYTAWARSEALQYNLSKKHVDCERKTPWISYIFLCCTLYCICNSIYLTCGWTVVHFGLAISLYISKGTIVTK